MNKYSKYVGLDVHKETVMVAIAKAGRQEAMQYGEVENTPETVEKMAKKVCADGNLL